MINEPLPFQDLNIRIPIITRIKGRGFVNHGSGLHPKPQTLSPMPVRIHQVRQHSRCMMLVLGCFDVCNSGLMRSPNMGDCMNGVSFCGDNACEPYLTVSGTSTYQPPAQRRIIPCKPI